MFRVEDCLPKVTLLAPQNAQPDFSDVFVFLAVYDGEKWYSEKQDLPTYFEDEPKETDAHAFWQLSHLVLEKLASISIPANKNTEITQFPASELDLTDLRLALSIAFFLLDLPIPDYIVNEKKEVPVSKNRVKALAEIIKKKLA